MTKSMGALAAAAAALAMIAAPAASFADSATHDYTTTLTQTQPIPSAGVFGGTLKLTVDSNGIASGWYIPNDAATYIQVTGGEQNGKFWLNVGDRGGFTIQGSVARNGRLLGSATALSEGAFGISDINGSGFPVTFDFVATPNSGY